jgi:cytochrome d ubiquinol oxidase subunit II
MAALWFWMVSVMIALYVVLDGFDFGAGVLHLFVARKDSERRQVLAAVGPWWDGNEVWLLAAGGTLLVAFPSVLGSGFSGFYLPMFLVLWVLILRAVGLELRSHVAHPMWRSLFDAAFMVGSALLPILLGAALGNVLRGVPLDASGFFALPLFTTFRTTGPLGVLDWYTVSVGVFALVATAAHGANFLAWRTTGPVRERSRKASTRLLGSLFVLWPAMTVATWVVRPGMATAFTERPAAWLFFALALVGLFAAEWGARTDKDAVAFFGSSAWLIGLLAATAACVWPVMLTSAVDPANSLTAPGAMAPEAGLRIALVWWCLGLPLSLVYAFILVRIHKARVPPPAEGSHGY